MDLRGASVCITGGAGFVGSHIADQVLAAGAGRVVIVDNFIRGRHENLEDAIATGRVEVIAGDICDRDLVDQAIAGTDLVFHQAAWRITHCAEDAVGAVRVMINGTQNVLDAAVRHGVQKVLSASSASVYGEPSYLPMDEAHPFNNRTLYGAAKIAGEQLLRAYAEMYGLHYVSLRPFNVYGPRMDVYGAYTEVMIRWLERLEQGAAPIIFGDGLQTMDFVYVEDVARAYVLAAQSEATDVVLNAGIGVETSLRELCDLLCEAAGHSGVKVDYQPARRVGPVTRRLAATERAREVIGFEACVPLREGLRQLVRWHSELRTVEPAGAR